MEQQRELCVEIALNMLDYANNDLEFMKTIITGDKIWVYGYNPESKFQSSQWNYLKSPRLKKAQLVCRNVKVMLTCFLDSCSIVYCKYAPEGQTINKEYYLEVLGCLCDAVQRHVHRKELAASP